MTQAPIRTGRRTFRQISDGPRTSRRQRLQSAKRTGEGGPKGKAAMPRDSLSTRPTTRRASSTTAVEHDGPACGIGSVGGGNTDKGSDVVAAAKEAVDIVGSVSLQESDVAPRRAGVDRLPGVGRRPLGEDPARAGPPEEGAAPGPTPFPPARLLHEVDQRAEDEACFQEPQDTPVIGADDFGDDPQGVVGADHDVALRLAGSATTRREGHRLETPGAGELALVKREKPQRHDAGEAGKAGIQDGKEAIERGLSGLRRQPVIEEREDARVGGDDGRPGLPASPLGPEHRGDAAGVVAKFGTGQEDVDVARQTRGVPGQCLGMVVGVEVRAKGKQQCRHGTEAGIADCGGHPEGTPVGR